MSTFSALGDRSFKQRFPHHPYIVGVLTSRAQGARSGLLRRHSWLPCHDQWGRGAELKAQLESEAAGRQCDWDRAVLDDSNLGQRDHNRSEWVHDRVLPGDLFRWKRRGHQGEHRCSDSHLRRDSPQRHRTGCRFRGRQSRTTVDSEWHTRDLQPRHRHTGRRAQRG